MSRTPARGWMRAALLPAALLVATACGGDGSRDGARDGARDATPDSVIATDRVAPTPSDALAPDTGWVASPQGLGPVRVGMPRSALLAHIGQPSRSGYYSHERCAYTGGTALPAGVQVMVFDSTVARVDVSKPGVRTREGAQVGDTEAAVLAKYRGRVAVTPHHYSGPQWHYLTVTTPGDTLHRIVFETDGARVQNFRVGRMPEVEWVEGCS